MRLDSFKLNRALETLHHAGLDGALFTDYYNVSYLTGYTMFLENGPSPFTRGAAAVLLLPNEIHLVAESPHESVQADDWSGTVVPYVGYSAEGSITGTREFLSTTLGMLHDHLPASGHFGYELSHLPAAIYAPLSAETSRSWLDLPSQMMLQVRAVKSADELRRLQTAAHLAEVGQAAVHRLVAEPGRSEIEVYNGAKQAMEVSVGGRFALQNALHGGPNSAVPVPGMPTDYELQAGDLLISDIVPFFDGYWADSCSTFAVGRVVTDESHRIHAVAREAFEMGFEAIRPGISGHQLAAIVKGTVQKYGHDYSHHTGHGVGVSNHEEPRITLGSQTLLEPDMVVLLEPAVYIEGLGGCRQERMIRVTADGAELMTHNPLVLV